jgi:hypothetical protein
MNLPYLDTRPRFLSPEKQAQAAALVLAMLRGEIKREECLARMAAL